jgi:hypothetical protein
LAVSVLLVWLATRDAPSSAEIQDYMNRAGCRPTNDFVGEDPERLYLCGDGVKYRWHDLHMGATNEKRDRRTK